MAKRDYYEVLGVSREASSEELRKAYRRLALQYHPDRNQGDPKAHAQFKELNEAYQVLSDEAKRRAYDQIGHDGLDGRAGGPTDWAVGDVFTHMQDLFSDMFSAGPRTPQASARMRPRGADVVFQAILTLREAAFGCKRDISVRSPVGCPACDATGSKPGSAPETCPGCRGSGQTTTSRGFVMFTATCTRCMGVGRIIVNACPNCGGIGAVERVRTLSVNFPRGIEQGQRLRMPGQGAPGAAGTPAGDLFIEIVLKHDARYARREGTVLVATAKISFGDAALGGDVRAPRLDSESDTIVVKVPSGTQPRASIRVKGEGMTIPGGPAEGPPMRDDMIVIVEVEVPTALSPKSRELLRAFDDSLKEAGP